MGWERVACNFCGSQAHITLFQIYESPDVRQPPAWRGTSAIPVVKCQQCGLVFLNPRYDDARLIALYQDPQTFVGTIDPEGNLRNIATERKLRVARSKDEVRALRKLRSHGRLLDVGCGLGFFLEALENDYAAFGLEWSHPAVELIKASPLQIVEERFPRHPFEKGEFDIITFNNVLDHLPDPLAALTEARVLLKPNGVLMLSLINIESLAARFYRAGFRLLGTNHLYYFSPQTIQNFLAKAGFRLIHIEYPYFGIDYAKPLEDMQRILKDWFNLKVLHSKETRLSPPFYGNVMRVFAIKLN